MKKVLLSFFILLFSYFLPAQQLSLENFTYLESSGEIPADFKQFINPALKTSDDNVYLKEMFLSGKIVYGSILNQYIDAIVDNLLREYPDLRRDMRFYVVKSPSVNAFATQSGIIFVNIGLIAQVSNEAELAFVLAHEIVHYVEDHVLKINDYLKNNKDNDFLSYHYRSREQESEADEYAIKRYFSSSNYSYAVLNGIFDVLQYAYLPFDEISFQRSFAEESFYQFPDKYYLAALNQIRSREDYIDTLSTHPNIQKRRQNTQAIVQNLDNSGRKAFIQDENLFYKIRDLARFECINQYLTDHNYGDAIYNLYVLQKEHSDNQFLDIAMASAIYGFHKHKMSGSITEVLSSYKKIEGEKQQVHYFFSHLNKKEANVLAIRFLWKAYQKYPQNEFLRAMCEDAAKDLVIRNRMSSIDFSDYPMGTVSDSIKDEPSLILPDTTAKTPQNKYDRIKQQTQGPQTKIKPIEKFTTVNYMLVDLKQDKEFLALLDNTIKTKEDENITTLLNDQKPTVGKIVIWRPVYYFLKKRNNETIIDYKKTKRGGINLEKTVKQSVKKLNIDNLLYSDDKIAGFNTEEYNQYVRLGEWLHDYHCGNSMVMKYYQSQNIKQTIDFTGTKHLNFLGAISRPGRFIDVYKVYSIIYSTTCLVYFPFSLVELAMPKYSTSISFNIINLETGETDYVDEFAINSEMRDAYINSVIYNSYYQVKKGKKSKK